MRSRTNEEQLIFVINEAMERAGLDLPQMFEFMDKDGSGLVTKADFRDAFSGESIAIDTGDLDRFIEYF